MDSGLNISTDELETGLVSFAKECEIPQSHRSRCDSPGAAPPGWGQRANRCVCEPRAAADIALGRGLLRSDRFISNKRKRGRVVCGRSPVKSERKC